MVGLDNPLHILLVLVVVLMVFGAKRLPDMGRGIGEGMRSFKQGISGEAHSEPVSLTHSEPVSLTPVQQHVSAAPVAAQVTTEQRESAPVA